MFYPDAALDSVTYSHDTSRQTLEYQINLTSPLLMRMRVDNEDLYIGIIQGYIQQAKRDILVTAFNDITYKPVCAQLDILLVENNRDYRPFEPQDLLRFYRYELDHILIRLSYFFTDKLEMKVIPFERMMDEVEVDNMLAEKWKKVETFNRLIADRKYRLYGWKKVTKFEQFIDWLTYVAFGYK